jgi:hypothetical protein
MRGRGRAAVADGPHSRPDKSTTSVTRATEPPPDFISRDHLGRRVLPFRERRPSTFRAAVRTVTVAIAAARDALEAAQAQLQAFDGEGVDED